MPATEAEAVQALVGIETGLGYAKQKAGFFKNPAFCFGALCLIAGHAFCILNRHLLFLRLGLSLVKCKFATSSRHTFNYPQILWQFLRSGGYKIDTLFYMAFTALNRLACFYFDKRR